MKINKYSLLTISLLAFTGIGIVLLFNYFKLEESINQSNDLQLSYNALNLEIINIVYLPTVIIIHMVLYFLFRFKDKKQKIVK